MLNDEVLNNLEKLNIDYLLLKNNPRVRDIIYSDEKHSFLYKIRKLIEIGHYLGIDILREYVKSMYQIRRETNNVSLHSNVHKCKIAVYTSIFGKIDSIIEPLYIPENIDYYIITDQDVCDKSHWKVINSSKHSFPPGLSNKLKNRYCKIFPDRFIMGYEYTIYVDGNILIVSDLSKLVDKMNGARIGIFSHPVRDDLYTEAAAVIYLNNAPGKEVRKQILNYKKEGFPRSFGLFENSLIIRKQEDKEIEKLMLDWWEQLNTFTCRDQLSFMYVLWKNNKDKSFVCSLGNNIDMCPIIRRVKHINK